VSEANSPAGPSRLTITHLIGPASEGAAVAHWRKLVGYVADLIRDAFIEADQLSAQEIEQILTAEDGTVVYVAIENEGEPDERLRGTVVLSRYEHLDQEAQSIIAELGEVDTAVLRELNDVCIFLRDSALVVIWYLIGDDSSLSEKGIGHTRAVSTALVTRIAGDLDAQAGRNLAVVAELTGRRTVEEQRVDGELPDGEGLTDRFIRQISAKEQLFGQYARLASSDRRLPTLTVIANNHPRADLLEPSFREDGGSRHPIGYGSGLLYAPIDEDLDLSVAQIRLAVYAATARLRRTVVLPDDARNKEYFAYLASLHQLDAS
jgi:hypothetical protein